MKKIFTLLLGVLFFFSLNAQNKITNGDFSTFSGNDPEGYTLTKAGSFIKAVMLKCDTAYHSAPYSLYIGQATTGTSRVTPNRIDLEPGSYTFSFWYRYKSGENAGASAGIKLNGLVYDNAAATAESTDPELKDLSLVLKSPIIDKTVKDEWIRYAKTFTVSKACNIAFELTTAVGTFVMIDDLELVEAPAIRFQAGTTSEITLAMGNTAAGGTVDIDWGDGIRVTSEVLPANPSLDYTESIEIKGTPKGNGIVSIYGNDLFYFDCAGKVNPVLVVAEWIDVNSTTLKKLAINSNGMTGALDLHSAPNLYSITANINKFTSADFSDMKSLVTINLSQNEISSLNINGCEKLRTLQLIKNNLTSIDVTQFDGLYELRLNSNKIESLDLSQNPILRSLYVQDNKLKTLDVSQNPNLEFFYFGTNNIKPSAMPEKPVKITKLARFSYAPQTFEIPASITTSETLDLSAEKSLKGVASEVKPTTFTWNNASGVLVEGTDYTENNGVFTFLKEQTDIYCVLTTEAYPAFTENNPCKTTLMTVTKGGSVSENKVSGRKVYAVDGTLYISDLQGGEQIDVISVSGQIVKSVKAANGENSIGIDSGLYIVRVNNERYKVLSR